MEFSKIVEKKIVPSSIVQTIGIPTHGSSSTKYELASCSSPFTQGSRLHQPSDLRTQMQPHQILLQHEAVVICATIALWFEFAVLNACCSAAKTIPRKSFVVTSAKNSNELCELLHVRKYMYVCVCVETNNKTSIFWKKILGFVICLKK